MDAADLRVFEAVARLGSMGRAAAALHTVQSNVTAHIRRLEDELGVALFRRHARGVEPTAPGMRLLPYAAEIAHLLEDARRAARDDGTPRGRLTIGSLETTAALRLPEKLAAFLGAFPEVDLMLRTGTTCELLEQVLDHRLDGAFVCGPVAHPGLAAETMFSEELVLLAPPALRSIDELLGRAEVRIVVLRLGCSYRQRLEDVLARRGVPAARVLEFGTIEAILGCVSAGLGVTLLPAGMAGAPGRVSRHRLPPRDGRVETVFVRRREGYAPSALERFLAIVRAGGGEVRTAAE